MTAGHLLLYIIYSIWSIISLYNIIKYPRVILKCRPYKLEEEIENKEYSTKYSKFLNLEDYEFCTPYTNLWLVSVLAIIIFLLIIFVSFLFTIKL